MHKINQFKFIEGDCEVICQTVDGGGQVKGVHLYGLKPVLQECFHVQ